MLKTIFNFVRRFPEQVFLFLFNSGIFAWLWKSGSDIANQLGVTAAWETHVPAPLQAFFGENVEAVQGFFPTFSHYVVGWFHDYSMDCSFCQRDDKAKSLCFDCFVGHLLGYAKSRSFS